eukprot:GHVU01154749.1.p1 GENE.GHVU01154749.1~~GHVU01154749.1.p1  ORF type:complete len:457 (-),score=44.36 GHVU01154749.1:778-2148(-)
MDAREAAAINELKGGPTFLQVEEHESYRNLAELLTEKKGPYTTQEAKKIMYSILRGLAYAHERNYVHRDVNPSKILVSDDLSVLKIADWGLARKFDLAEETYTREVVTLWYRPPEIMFGARKYGPKVDCWSAGCILAELVKGTPLFPGGHEMSMLYDHIFRVLGTPMDADSWPGLQDSSLVARALEMGPKHKPLDALFDGDQRLLGEGGIRVLRGLLQLNPANRLSAQRALQDPWFDDIRAEVGDPAPSVSRKRKLPLLQASTGSMPLWDAQRGAPAAANQADRQQQVPPSATPFDGTSSLPGELQQQEIAATAAALKTGTERDVHQLVAGKSRQSCRSIRTTGSTNPTPLEIVDCSSSSEFAAALNAPSSSVSSHVGLAVKSSKDHNALRCSQSTAATLGRSMESNSSNGGSGSNSQQLHTQSTSGGQSQGYSYNSALLGEGGKRCRLFRVRVRS